MDADELYALATGKRTTLSTRAIRILGYEYTKSGNRISGLQNEDLLDVEKIYQAVLSGEILLVRGIGKGILREVCEWLVIKRKDEPE